MSSSANPPSPVHPRDFDTSVRNMAETQLPPNFPISTFLGHPERYHGSINFGLPSIHGAPGTIASSRPAPSQGYPILPPLRMHGPLQPISQAHPPQAVPISKLLSDSPRTTHSMRPPSLPQYPAAVTSPVPAPFVGSRPLYQPTYQASPSITLPPPSAIPFSSYRQSSPVATQNYRSTPPVQPTQSPRVISRSSSLHSTDSMSSPREPLSAISEQYEHTTPRDSPASSIKYALSMRQQPIAARACGFGERDRRVVDPPPIVDVTLTDKNGETNEDETPGVYTTLHCTIVHADNYLDASQIEQSRTDMAMTQRLMGTCVASPFPGKDDLGRKGTFFVFPDLSCRSPGRYRFLFRLIIVDHLHLMMGGTTRIQSQIFSEPFEVYSAKEFPGMRASSALLKTLRKQGLNVAVKKGREATKKSSRKAHTDGDDSEDDEEGAEEDEEEDDDQEADRHESKKRKRSTQ